MCESVRAITAIKYNLEQLNNFYNDLSILDKYTDDYEKEYNDLLDNTERLRADFSALYGKILNENEELKKNYLK
jgi:hypothetical protein